MASKTIDIRLGSKFNGSGISAAMKSLRGLAKGAADIKAGFDMTLGAIRSFAGVVGSVLQKAFDAEYALTNFKTMLGTIDAAKQHVAELKSFAASTPLTFGDLSQASKTLLAFGADVQTVMPSLKMLGDISLGNAEKFQSLALAFGKVQSEGKLSGVTLKQMIIAGFNPLQEIAAKTGASMDELKKQMEEGRISFDLVQAAMKSATSEGGRFNNAMKDASQTGAGLVSTLKDNWTAAVTKFGEAFLDSAKGGLSFMIEKLQELNKSGTIDEWASRAVDWLGKVDEGAKAVIGPLAKIGEWSWKRINGVFQSTAQGVGNFVGTLQGGGGIMDALRAARAGQKQGWTDALDSDGAEAEKRKAIREKARIRAAATEEKKAVAETASIKELYDKSLAQKAAAEREKEELAVAKKLAAERERLEAELHKKRMADLKAEIDAQKTAATPLQKTIDAAQTEFERAFSMYRDPEQAAAQIAEERDYAADLNQLHKDASRYGGKWRIDQLSQLMAAGDTQGVQARLEDWRRSKSFTPEVEAMVRASAAEQTKTTAEDELRKLNDKTADLSAKLETLAATRDTKLEGIERNTNQLATKLDELLSVKG